MHVMIHIDGGARGNPGPAGVGVVIQTPIDAGSARLLHAAGYFLGRATNNVAEYRGLIRALEQARALGARSTDIYSDSKLIVEQVHGRWKVKKAHLRPLAEQARRLLGELDHWTLTHVRREENEKADALANEAMDARADVVRASSPAPG